VSAFCLYTADNLYSTYKLAGFINLFTGCFNFFNIEIKDVFLIKLS